MARTTVHHGSDEQIFYLFAILPRTYRDANWLITRGASAEVGSEGNDLRAGSGANVVGNGCGAIPVT